MRACILRLSLLVPWRVALLGSCAGPPPAAGGTKLEAGSTIGRRIDSIVRRYERLNEFSGAVLVAEGGQVVYRDAVGLADRERGNPNTPATQFRIGSVTKAFTAMLVLQLVDKGKVTLDAPLSAYLPTFPERLGRRITARQLLTHTSGLPDYNDVPDFFEAVQRGELTDAEILQRVGAYELRFEPGTKFGYSNDGYRLLGALVEQVTGTSYERAVADRILGPAGMSSTGMSHRDVPPAFMATGYRRLRFGVLERARYYRESSAAGLYSTVDDLFKLDQALEGSGVASPSMKRVMWAESPYRDAYGWQVRRHDVGIGDSVLVIGADGTVFGFRALTFRVEAPRRFVALLANVRGQDNPLPEMGDAILATLYRQR